MFLLLGLVITSCRQAKYVPDGKYLLKKSEIYYMADGDSTAEWEESHPQIKEWEVEELVQPRRNSKFLGMKFKLRFYNSIDTNKYNKQVERKKVKHDKKVEKKRKKVNEVNEKRIKKAREKGKEYYRQKVYKPKDVKLGWRHWVRTRWGEAPVIVDTAKIHKCEDQMKIFLSQKGFRYAEITDSIEYLKPKKKKATVKYYIKPGRPYVINKITFDDDPYTRRVKDMYYNKKKGYLENNESLLKEGALLDEDNLEEERSKFTSFLLDEAYFGFTENYINYVVDTTVGDYKADVVIFVKKKKIIDVYSKDTVLTTHHPYLINDVTYVLHNPDSLSFKDYELYKERCKKLGLEIKKNDGTYQLLDTLYIVDTVITKQFINLNKDIRKDHDLKVFQKFIDTNINYKGYFIFNEEPFIDPYLLDKQNFLEHTEADYPHYAKNYYVDRSYQGFYRLDIFSRVVADVYVTPGKPLGNTVDVTYEMTPTPKQFFNAEPRATNTSSILGVSGMVSYTNKNLFKAANQLQITMEGGFQSQPLVVGTGEEGTKRFDFRGLNTFEWGPEIKYRIPKLYPMTKKMQENVSKRMLPTTEMNLSYNYQRRQEFKRHIGEFGYKWEFWSASMTQIITVSPLSLNYVTLDKDSLFNLNLIQTNDPFLINSYSDFFSIGILNFNHDYSSTRKKSQDSNKGKKLKNHAISNVFDLRAAGLVMNSIFAAADQDSAFVPSFNEEGKHVLGVPFAQFMRFENTLVFNQYISRYQRMVYRFIGGVGFAYGNGISLPYTESFVAGGSNDIRAFPARTMAPGGTQTYKDPNATSTQIGDLKLELNLEWRFRMTGSLHGALFMDIGNIWKLQADPSLAFDPGVFRFDDFYKQVAIGAGYGFRYDIEFLIIRLDLAWALYNPYLDAGERWWLTAKDQYYSNFKVDANGVKVNYVLPHRLAFNFGIGYPF
ncbi:BamA/TamA family outer membrane protein [Paracrocinitomix mangrovi]|uniref:BamA/TamA family outer membrane protein n=1 Tax=Paracrocinitomix mangrovi TaxID=2862509 RepID=UPI001C8EF440|nr:BamA/TamA family outer membrane protein [Paracrocinitomix mangrovi]UKN02870.1 BamA/TamA family outer membrane protein [Paracrocinitomix mangrovi]